jgi:hypothetical protein
MSLPAAQQRILDGIADGLRRSEPRLAAMYATFTRMCGSEGPPIREQLARGWAWRSAAAVVIWLRGKLTDQGRRTRRRILIASQVAIALALVGVLVGMNARSSDTCGQAGRQGSAAQTRQWCPTAANGMIGK